MANENINLDPVQGLIDYVNDIKPYHSKVIEALIEYVGIENLQVTIIENFQLGIDFVFEFDGVFICVGGGFDGLPYGDPESIPILSPDPTKSVIEYPAFGNGFFIVLGDKTKLFDPLVNLNFNVMSFIDDKLVDVSASTLTGSPSSETGGTFSIIGDKTTEFAIGTIFNITGSAENDKTYIVTAVSFGGAPLRTTISVEGQKVNSEFVEGFARRSDPSNSGDFIVTTSSYNRSLFTPHTTVFITGLSMTLPTLEDDNQRFVSLVNIKPLEYTKILSHSNELKYLDSSPAAFTQTPDEGVALPPIVNISTSPAAFSVLGNFDASNLYVGDEITVQQSTGNNGIYIITSILYNFDVTVGDFVTTFGVASIPNSNIDGLLKLNIPSNVFIVANDYTEFFVQGSKINVISGSKKGVYTVLNSRFYNNATYIRVLENLIDDGNGRLIVGTGGSPSDSIVVDGNVAASYKQNKQFNIVRSLKNNGLYTTSSDAVYDVGNNTTTIPIVEPFNLTDNTGEIHEFAKGTLTALATGFGQTPELCEIIPATLLHVNIREKLFFNNIQIRINENVIATGFNSHQWGYELPASTVFQTTQPTVAFSNTAPGSPSDGDFWFDTSPNTGSPTGPGILKQYRLTSTGSPFAFEWIDITTKKIYWIDTDTNYLYYRIINQYYDKSGSPASYTYPIPSVSNGMDSDWILELTLIPGLNTTQVGVSIREQVAYESFFAKESSTAVADTNFTFAINGSPLTQNSIPTIIAGSPPTAVPNTELIEVMVDGTPASINIISTTEFEIISPRMHVGDFVEARIYDLTGTQTATYVGSFDANAAIDETLDMFLGYNFSIGGTEAATKNIYIPDSTGIAFTIFTDGLGASDDALEIILSGGSPNIDGQYTLTGVATDGASPPVYTILTVSEPILDSGIFTAPEISSGHLLYQQWFQYFILNTTANSIIVFGDATTDIINGASIKIGFSATNNGTYTVNAPPTFNGTNTTIPVAPALTTIGEAGSWVEST